MPAVGADCAQWPRGDTMLSMSQLLPSGATQQSNSAGTIAIPELLPTLATPLISLLPSSWDETESSLSCSTGQPPDRKSPASRPARLQQLQTLMWPSAPLKIEQLIQTKFTKVALNPPWKNTQALDQHLIDQLTPGCLEVQQEPDMVSLNLCCLELLACCVWWAFLELRHLNAAGTRSKFLTTSIASRTLSNGLYLQVSAHCRSDGQAVQERAAQKAQAGYCAASCCQIQPAASLIADITFSLPFHHVIDSHSSELDVCSTQQLLRQLLQCCDFCTKLGILNRCCCR